MNGKIEILLVDDHTIVRQGLRLVVESTEDMCVVGEAEDGQRAVELARKLTPDVVLLDIMMPTLNGADTTRQLLNAVPSSKVLVLSAYGDDDRIHQLIEAGASGYLVKQSAGDELLNAIRQIYQGNAYLSPAICKTVLEKCRQALRLRVLQIASSPQLSRRELQVLQLVARGYANKQIADELKVTVKSVEKYRQDLMDKLNLHNTAALTRYAIARGVVHSERSSFQLHA